jgi:hypothetical protein
MTRPKSRRVATYALALLVFAPLGGCVSPFSPHADDVTDAFAVKFRDMHRKYDRYILGLDWDDPYHQWHDESYATGSIHSH